jgi:nucleoid-associated protein YgaU
MAARHNFIFAVFLMLAMTGCSTPAPLWHQQAGQIIQAARTGGAPSLLPSEYGSLVDAFSKGENLLLEEDVEEADQLFKLIILKGQLLNENLIAEKRRVAEVERVRLLEQQNLEKQQLEKERLEAIERANESRRREAEEVRARIANQAKIDAETEVRRQAERLKVQKERPLVASHTVKRGESLPQIAALPEVYNDSLLWPLIYRANRDQIRDPRNLWPGQSLRIPRNYSREDLQEARRYAQDRRLH